jgi:copper(I)-binding protein
MPTWSAIMMRLAQRLLVVAIIAFSYSKAVASNADEGAIRHLLMSTFDRPESRLVVEPVVVTGGHAIAGWAQGDMGGRALLRRRHGTWSLILCSGDGIKSADALHHAGVPSADATTLSQQLADAESRLPRERLVLFAKFEGTLMMDASGNHPQHPPMQQSQTSAPMLHAQMQHGPMTNQQPPAQTQTFKVGNIVIVGPWLRATPKGATVAGGYMTITNNGGEPDRLVGGTLEHAVRFEVHEMTMVDHVMKMRPLAQGLEIKPGATVELKPGGFHIMGIDLHAGYTQGDVVKGTLVFEKAGTVAVEYRVVPIGGSMPHAGH